MFQGHHHGLLDQVPLADLEVVLVHAEVGQLEGELGCVQQLLVTAPRGAGGVRQGSRSG